MFDSLLPKKGKARHVSNIIHKYSYNAKTYTSLPIDYPARKDVGSCWHLNLI